MIKGNAQKRNDIQLFIVYHTLAAMREVCTGLHRGTSRHGLVPAHGRQTAKFRADDRLFRRPYRDLFRAEKCKTVYFRFAFKDGLCLLNGTRLCTPAYIKFRLMHEVQVNRTSLPFAQTWPAFLTPGELQVSSGGQRQCKVNNIYDGA